MITNPDEIVNRARFMLGAPFLHQGRGLEGIDCIGEVAWAYGIDADAIPAYARDPHNGQLECELEAVFGMPVAFAPVIDADLRKADLVVMQYAGPSRHVGIIATFENRFTLIHTDSTLGKVTEHSLDFKWLRRITRIHRL